MLSEVDFGRTEAAVRVNSVSSGLAEEDLRVVMAAPRLPATIMLPKVESPQELDWVHMFYSSISCKRNIS